MSTRTPKSEPLTGTLTVGWSNKEERAEAMAKYEEAQGAYEPIRSFGSYQYQNFIDIEPNKTVRPGYNPQDYYAFRPGESVPSRSKRIIKMCMDAYDKVGIIKNVIDLMGDFGSQGIQLVHEDPEAEDFFQQWFKKVDGKERSERFLNTLYRTGNVMIYRSTAKITPKIEEYIKSLGAKTDVVIQIPDFKERQIPWRYNFINPLSVECVKGELNMFLGHQQSFEVNTGGVFNNFKATEIPETMFDTLPKDIRNLLKNGAKKIPLDPERLHIAYYKKDDWMMWAHPMIYAILDDVITLQKMRLADLSALDGAISNIRLWTLGDFEYKVLPTKAGINKLRNILASNVGGGTMELVWGPELKYTESNSQVYKFLGSEKYTTVLNSIYAGLGVPPTLTGMATNGGGFTNNFISLKTLTERLQYGRDLLTKFWEKELEIVRRAMGFKKAPRIMFDQMTLSDDSVEKKLLMDLADRDIISSETLLERFKEIPEVEKMRLQREEISRKKEHLPPKLGPFPSAIVPNTVNKDGTPKSTIIEGNGRPRFRKDSSPRKKRVDTPKTTPGVAELFIWTQGAYDDISEYTNKAFLAMNNKTNMRQLTKEQVSTLETLKLDILSHSTVLGKVCEKEIHAILQENLTTPRQFKQHVVANKINPIDMNMEDYKRRLTADFVEYLMAQFA